MDVRIYGSYRHIDNRRFRPSDLESAGRQPFKYKPNGAIPGTMLEFERTAAPGKVLRSSSCGLRLGRITFLWHLGDLEFGFIAKGSGLDVRVVIPSTIASHLGSRRNRQIGMHVVGSSCDCT